jgi:hypothetical protein
MGALRRSLLAAVGGLLLGALFFASTAARSPRHYPAAISRTGDRPGGATVSFTATRAIPRTDASFVLHPHPASTFPSGQPPSDCSVTDAEKLTVTGSSTSRFRTDRSPQSRLVRRHRRRTGEGGHVLTTGWILPTSRSGSACDPVSAAFSLLGSRLSRARPRTRRQHGLSHVHRDRRRRDSARSRRVRYRTRGDKPERRGREFHSLPRPTR